MKKGDRVRVKGHSSFYGRDSKVGDEGEIAGFGFQISCHWGEGHPIDTMVDVRLDDGRVVSQWKSDLELMI